MLQLLYSLFIYAIFFMELTISVDKIAKRVEKGVVFINLAHTIKKVSI